LEALFDDDNPFFSLDMDLKTQQQEAPAKPVIINRRIMVLDLPSCNGITT